jgi:eukaryotic-like serine/threonine-protein kinase
MDNTPRCQRCDAPVTDQAVGGLCANCLLQLALELPAEPTGMVTELTHASAQPMSARPLGDHERVEETGDVTAAPREAVGSRIGRYKLLQKMGEGGFGVVWMAEQLEPVTRRVALKIIKLGMDTREVIARFEAERQALAMMDHPNIAKVFDAGATDRGRPFFVMELVKGIPITTFCDENHLRTRERLQLFGEVCDAIQHAHQKGIIHRDIKPSNVLVTLDGGKAVPRVIDFGIAKATQGKLTDKTLVTRFEQFIGTPAYMSPEQAGMAGVDIDTRSDIYALGILLYELLTGKPPFDAKLLISAGYEEMRRIIREVEPPKPSSRLSTIAGDERTTLAKARHIEPGKLRRMVEPDLDWIVMKAIEKDRSRRYETVNGLALDVEHFLSNEPVSAGPPGPAYRFHKYVRRNKVMLRVAIMLIAATAVSTVMAVRAERERLEARAQTTRAEREKAMAKAATERLRQQLREAAQSDRINAHRLAGQGRFRDALVLLARACEYAPESSAAAEQAVLLGNSTSFHLPVTTFSGHGGAINSAQFSPDGSRIAVASDDNPAWVCDAATGRLIATFAGHTEEIRSVQFSGNGARIATASDDDTARVWDSTTGGLMAELSGHTGDVNTAEFSPNGARIATASDDDTARVWDSTTGGLIAELSGHTGDVNTAEFSPDGARIVTASDDDTARVWDAVNGRLIAILTGHESGEDTVMTLPGNEADVNTAHFSPDGTRIVTSSNDNTGRVWDATSSLHILTLRGHQDRLRDAEFSPDGTRILTHSEDKTARVWDASTGQPIHVLSGHSERLRSAHFSPDGQRVVTVSDDRTARIWETTSGRLIATLSGHQQRLRSGWFSPDGARVVTSSDDGLACVWDLTSSRPVTMPSGPRHRVWNGRFSPDGRRILTTSHDGIARAWDVPAGRLQAMLFGTQDRAWNAMFSPDGTRAITASDDVTARVWDAATGGLVAELSSRQGNNDLGQSSPNDAGSHDDSARVWNASTGQLIATLTSHGAEIRTAQFSPNGEQVVTASDDTIGRVWNASTGRLVAALTGHELRLNGAEFNPDGGRILTSSDDQTARVWDAKTGELIHTLSGHTGSLGSAQFSPNGTRIVTASDDKTARLWDASTGQLTATLSGHQLRVRGAKFSPSGDRILTNSNDNTARVWNAETGQPIHTLSGHLGRLRDAQFSPDGQRIITASEDKTARVWDASTGHLIATLTEHEQRVRSGRFSPDGTRLVTSSDDGTARVWESLGTAGPPPPWFPHLLRVIAAGTLTAEGELGELPVSIGLALRAEVLIAAKDDHDRYGDIARYHLTPGPGKPVRPGAKMTCREAADSLISADATSWQTEHAYALDPAHPLVQIALARFAESEAQADFLRGYGLDRIGSDVPAPIIRRAAALLAVQPGQEAKELRLIERVEVCASGAALADVRYRKAMLLAGLGRGNESYAIYRELLATASQPRQVVLPEAMLIASRTGRAEEAAGLWEECVRSAPGDERSRRFGGWCRLILGDAPNALELFHAGGAASRGDRAATDAEIDRQLGLSLALIAAGKIQEALETFRPLVAEHPGLNHPTLARRLNWSAVETKWMVELQQCLEHTSALLDPGLGPTWIEAPPEYAAGPLGHP